MNVTFHDRDLPRSLTNPRRPYNYRNPHSVRALYDGRRVVSVSPRSIRVWDRADGTLLRLIAPSPPFRFPSYDQSAVTSQGAVLIKIEHDLWKLSLDTLSLEHCFNDVDNEHGTLLLSPCDGLLASTGSCIKELISVYCATTWKKLWSVPGGDSMPPMLTFSSDGLLLLREEEIPQQAGSELWGFSVLNARTGKLLVAECATGYLKYAYFSPDETTLNFGNEGSPPKVSLPIPRQGKLRKRRGQPSRDPLTLRQYKTFTPFRDELRRRR